MLDFTLETRLRNELGEADLRELIALTGRAFRGERLEPLFLHGLAPTAVHALATLDGRLVAHACFTPRWARIGDGPPLRTAFVYAVAVEPALQGHGVGSACMRKLQLAMDDYQLGALTTDRIAFYERLGWERWQGPKAMDTGYRLLPTPEIAGVMILRLPDTPPLEVTDTLIIHGDRW